MRTEQISLAGNNYSIYIDFQRNELTLAKNGKKIEPIAIFNEDGVFEYISINNFFTVSKIGENYISEDEKIPLIEAENIVRDAAIEHIKKLANLLNNTIENEDYSTIYEEEINNHALILTDEEKKLLARDHVFATVRDNPLRGCFINKYNGEYFPFKRMGLDRHFPVFTRKELYAFGVVPMEIDKSKEFLKTFGYVIDKEWRLPRKRGNLNYFDKLYAEYPK